MMVNNPDPTTTHTHKLVVTRELSAPRSLVWKAWTDPEQTMQWLQLGGGVTTESVRMDLRPGGRYRYQQRMADGEYYTAAGTYLEVQAPERLVFTWDFEKDGAGTEFGELEGNETLVTVELREIGNRKTQLTLTHEKFTKVKSRDAHERGWTQWLGSLEKHFEA